MNAQQEIEAYRGWPVTHHGPIKTGLLFSAPDGQFVPVYLAERLARDVDALNQRVNQLSDANTYLRTMIQNERDRDANLTNQKLEAAIDQLAKAEAHVKELDATCAELVTDGNALTLAANLAKQSQRAEQAEARVKELEFGLKHQCETCEMKSIFDGEHAYALKMQARVKELESGNAGITDALNRTAHSEKILHARVKELEASRDNALRERTEAIEQGARDARRADKNAVANAELQKQEDESRRLFYAEQDKRQSAEFRCEELAGALAKIKDATGDEGETWENVAAWMAAVASSALARREVQP